MFAPSIVTKEMHIKMPPIVPSQVFLGEIFVKGVFPIKDPTKYAAVSFIQIEKIIPQGINGENNWLPSIVCVPR